MRSRQIEAFRFVMVTGTVTAAAEALALTQPAVSRLIIDLEQSLGFMLFDRHKGRLQPTAEAIRFYRGVEQFYMGMDWLERIAEQIRTQQPADLKVCATPALSTFVFPEAVKRFKASYPGVSLMIESLSSSETITRLQTHLAHMAITLGFPDVDGIVQEPLIEAPHVCAVHETHPLAARDVVRPEDLSGENVLKILPSGLVNWNLVDKALTEAGVRYGQSIGIQNSHTGYSLVAANLAVAIIEPFAASVWLSNGVVVRPFEPKLTFQYVIARPKALQHTRPLQAFAKIVREICRPSGSSLALIAGNAAARG